ncbi:preprotein translocase subunit SecA [Patescibacteria group bacterium]|nr:preprotein translocase subunit SecA [Patescibacteria group bacterium]
MTTFLDKLVGRKHRLLREAERIVPLVQKEEERLKSLTSEDLRDTARRLRAELADGATLASLLPRAFAAVREASRRTLGERHYDVQIIGGYVLHFGGIAEMRTGEGKTLVATLPAFLNALPGKGVHVVTVNDYLARRDGAWMGQVYAALGLTVSVINHEASYIYDETFVKKEEQDVLDAERDESGSYKVVHEFLRPVDRRTAYTADIVYGTNNEYGFDYLRDNLEYEPDRVRQRAHYFAVIDEVDSILIDEARTPLIISGPSRDPEELYRRFAEIASSMTAPQHYTIEEKSRAILLTDAGIEKAEQELGIENMYAEGGAKLAHHLESAVKAKALYLRDREYVIKDGEIVIVDEFTGRLQPGRRWAEGIHQAVEAKEGVRIQRESQTYASITFQNYFRMYERVAGMTGTASTSIEEFQSVYNLEVVTIPTHLPIRRIDYPDKIFQSERGKFAALAREVAERHEKGQPVLVGTTSIEMNERLAQHLKDSGIPHAVLNAKNHEREGEIIADAGRIHAVTVATNMAGRGVDIKLGGPHATAEEREAVRALGGLFVVGTERHDARRIDNQLRGRAGRQGDPGETQFYVSLEDKLMRIFASDMVKSLMGTLGIKEEEPIQSAMVSRALESAQEKIEGVNFDSRKHVLGFDDVLNIQRSAVYTKRRAVLLGSEPEVLAILEEILNTVSGDTSVIASKRAELTDQVFTASIRRLLLQAYDLFWIDHLETMEYLRNSVNLRSWGGRDPFVEYRKEGLRAYRRLEESLASFVRQALERMTPPQTGSAELSMKAPQKSYDRNERVTVTDGTTTREVKFKKVGELLAKGWRIVQY